MTKLDNIRDKKPTLDENPNPYGTPTPYENFTLFIGAGSFIIAALLYTIDLVSLQATLFITVASVVTYMVTRSASAAEPKHLRLYRFVTMVLWMPLFYVHFYDSWFMPALNGLFASFSAK